VGTYNGNPLTMAAARASIEHVLTDEAYAHLNMLNDRLMGGDMPRKTGPFLITR
jgi:glutamate-1-semialdehyde 2,1-aminomutase